MCYGSIILLNTFILVMMSGLTVMKLGNLIVTDIYFDSHPEFG